MDRNPHSAGRRHRNARFQRSEQRRQKSNWNSLNRCRRVDHNTFGDVDIWQEEPALGDKIRSVIKTETSGAVRMSIGSAVSFTIPL